MLPSSFINNITPQTATWALGIQSYISTRDPINVYIYANIYTSYRIPISDMNRLAIAMNFFRDRVGLYLVKSSGQELESGG